MRKIARINMLFALALLSALTVSGAGCKKTAEAPPPANVVTDPGEPTHAQSKLRTMKIWLGPEEMVAELALTAQEERTGMMFRTNMAETDGMLFPLPYTQRASFWMKNCPLPLSAAYIDPEGVIQEIHDLHSYDTNPVEASTDNIRFVLETPEGWFGRHHIGTGTLIRTERGSLMDTFFHQ